MASNQELLEEIEKLKEALKNSQPQKEVVKEVTYVSKEKKLDAFSGDQKNKKDVREWIDECKAAIESPRFRVDPKKPEVVDHTQQVNFILRHLEGKAKEVKIHAMMANFPNQKKSSSSLLRHLAQQDPSQRHRRTSLKEDSAKANLSMTFHMTFVV